MRAPGFHSGDFLCSHTLAPSFRMKTSDSYVRCSLWWKIQLIVLLLAVQGFASATSATPQPPAPTPPHPTSAHTTGQAVASPTSTSPLFSSSSSHPVPPSTPSPPTSAQTTGQGFASATFASPPPSPSPPPPPSTLRPPTSAETTGQASASPTSASPLFPSSSSSPAPPSTPPPPTSAQTTVQASISSSSAAPTIYLTPTTAAQSPVYYVVDVTVNVTGEKKNESEIIVWLQQAFQNRLENCLFSNPKETTTAPISPQTTNTFTTNVTSQPTTASGIYNLTTTAVSTMLQNYSATTAATSESAAVNDTATAAKSTSTATRNYVVPVSATLTSHQPTSSPGRSDNVTQSSSIINNTTSLFQGIEVSCTITNQIRNTTCNVTLSLNQSVPPCCILSTICAASKNSSDIHVIGNRADRKNLNECSTTPNEENSCIYSGPLGSSCEESGPAYVVPQRNLTNCGAGNNTCSCSAYCNKSDAFYNFSIIITNPKINSSYVSSLISTIKLPPCNISTNAACLLANISSEYKDVNMTCEVTATNQSCGGILRFAHEVPICCVEAALMNVFQCEKQIFYNRQVGKAAICGNTDDPLHSQVKWVQSDLKPEDFCTNIQSNISKCQDGKDVVVQLQEQCLNDDVPVTVSPNVTTMEPNSTTLSVNVTPSILKTTTAITVTTQNNTTQIPNVNTSAAGVTTAMNSTTTTSLSVTTPGNSTAAGTAESQANALLELTKDVTKLTSQQINELVSQLQRLLSGPTVSMVLGNTSIYIVSNLLGAAPEKLSSFSSRIIGIVDTVGSKLVIGQNAQTLLSPSVALSAKPADGANFQETVFAISDPNNVQVREQTRLRRSVLHSSINQGSITLPPFLTQNLTHEEQQLVSRVHFNFYQKSTVFQDQSLGSRKLNSGILGASVANFSIKGLQNNVIIRLRNNAPVPANFSPTCVFWDFTFNNYSGGWNSNGCIVQNTTDNETVCGCNHLTSFAILLDISRGTLTNPLQATILSFITYIGCGLSAIFLSITLLTYLAFEKLRKDIPSKILIQLCLALLFLNLVFLVDAWLALYPEAVGLCISTAWFLHYFLLASFTWMGLEGFHMYMALVKVFNSYISSYMLKFSLVGWGVPMIVVIIVIAINKDNYGLVSYGKFTDGSSDDFCWLKNDIAFYVAVVAYFCVVFLFNFIMFIVVLVQMRRIKRQNPHSVQHRTMLQDVRSMTGITILLGLTWGFAFFAWGPVNLAFMYLFAIFNSLQGFFIFVFHCAVKESVRRQWRTYLCCGKMRLLENSEWSRTATQKITKKSSLSKMTSLHSSNSSRGNNSTSFLVSDSLEQLNGIGSPFEDRAITADEEPSMDVVLNEIHRQYRNQQTS
ncbi:adhesion G-protein coupled receptor G2 isoform X2 [Melanotaenia boesemani]|uniref:adhesion G-protein coupled receptor G2 isoform X2 n=1 Tax=Melanotaenia boesemani TaxID=1250792 RepID=UPI001C046D3F|nr:adhesion G-protein coupled receptor G2 isoform X2 [Melanotaenia boesemani]